jgi:SagB-type dehydrogenase family enzyme
VTSPRVFFRQSELDRTSWPELREQMLGYNPDDPHPEPRTYPGHPRWPLPRLRPRLWPSLDRVLTARRSHRLLSGEAPGRKILSRLLGFSHGVAAGTGRGPVPSAGGLQALELYLVLLTPGWAPAGLYHYDRTTHELAQLAAGADRSSWLEKAPSLFQVSGGALLWVVVGDAPRVEDKYGARGLRFLLLEAGHLMQNLCLASASLGWATVPLGGFLECDISGAFPLASTDVVLYVGVCGKPASTRRSPNGGSD